MAKAYERGATLTELAQRHRLTLPVVRQHLVDAGVTIRRKGGSSSDDQQRVEEMTRLYVEENQTLQQIGERYGLSRQRVQQILRGAGVESQGRRATEPSEPAKPEPLTKEERQIARLYDRGNRPADIMQEFGITYSALQSILRRGGVKIKPKGFFNRRPDYERIHKGVIRDYKRGLDTGTIAEKHGLCGRTEIYKFLRREGIEVRHQHREEAHA